MKRSVFFLITAIIGLLVGTMLILIPKTGAENFGVMTSTPEILVIIRILGLKKRFCKPPRKTLPWCRHLVCPA